MPRSSRRNSRTLARPSRSSDPVCACRRRVPSRVSLGSRLTGTTDCLGAGRTPLARALDRPNATPAKPLSPCVSGPDAGVIRNVALGVSRRSGEPGSPTSYCFVIEPDRPQSRARYVPLASVRIAGRDFTKAGACPGRQTAGPSESIIRHQTMPAFSRLIPGRPPARSETSPAMRKTGVRRAHGR